MAWLIYQFGLQMYSVWSSSPTDEGEGALVAKDILCTQAYIR